MKKLVLTVFCLSITMCVIGQSTIPSIDMKDLEGNKVNSSTFSNDGKPIIIDFWATWCKPCIRELSNINEVYEDWQDETGVKIIAISIDDSRTSPKVAPFVNGRGWEYEVYVDQNSDFKRAMNVNNVPHTFLLNGKGEVVWQHNSYVIGDENELYEKVKELSKESVEAVISSDKKGKEATEEKVENKGDLEGKDKKVKGKKVKGEKKVNEKDNELTEGE